MTLGLIWAQSTTGVIGWAGRLPWHLPEDLAHFRKVTLGHPVIMGRRTWESLPEPFRPLPGRRNMVLTRQRDLDLPGAETIGSVAEALAMVGDGPAWVIGGAQTFDAFGHLASAAEVTEVALEVAGDTVAPSLSGWTLVSAGPWRSSTAGPRYRHLRYTRPPGEGGAGG